MILEIKLAFINDYGKPQHTTKNNIKSMAVIKSVHAITPRNMIIIITSNLIYNLSRLIVVSGTQYKQTWHSSVYICQTSLFNGKDCSN